MATTTDLRADSGTPGRVVAGPFAWSPPEPPQKSKWGLIGGPIAVLLAVVFVIAQIRLPYVAIAPGGAEPINQLLRVPKEHQHPSKGSFLLTTVSLLSDVRPFDFVRDWIDDDYELIKKKDLLGDTSEKQYTQIAQQEMTDSKEAAVVLAFRTLGYPVAESGEGALIVGLAEGEVPAKGVLAAGDAITMLDGIPTPLASDAITILQKHKPGDSIIATVNSGKTTEQRTIRLGSRTETSCTAAVVQGALGGGCLGVTLGTKAHKFDYPFKVEIDTTGVGGPSAGLAFTLALIDELTPGELTGGRDVAVTGTIDINGTVGDVGGVVQKTAAVRNRGARLFLVPPGEFEQARQHAGKKLKIVQVTTLAEALAALRANGGDEVKLSAT